MGDWDERIAAIGERRAMAREQGGPEAIARQHAKGRLALRERIDGLLDRNSFSELGMGAGSAETDDAGRLTAFRPANFILGFGEIDGRPVIVGGEDFTLQGGSPNAAGLRKSIYSEELAMQYRVPLVRLHEGGGGSVAGAGGKGSTGPTGEPPYTPHRFLSVARTLGTVPVCAAALGPVAGLPAARLVASHFSVMTRETAQVLVAGPAVVERALGVKLTKEELGGAQVHLKSGAVDNMAVDEQDAFDQIRRFLSYLPPNVDHLPPVAACDDPADRCEDRLASIVPGDRRKAYDMRRLVGHVVDRDSFFETGRQYGPSQITGLARLGGRPVGIWGNDCRYYAGAMSADGARKIRRFIEFCETFHLPIVAFVDEPGFMIGPDAEAEGTIRPGTAAVLAAADCRVPWCSVVIRKNFGVAAAAHYASQAHVLAWPSAEFGPLPVEGGVAVAYHREIAAHPDPEAYRRELEDRLAARQSPFARAESFAFHELIDPRETRPMLCRWVALNQHRLEALKGPRSFTLRP
ncbi:MAG: carboxyl transferase domain-containing protein [Pseudomonadota bacterium]|nr:carboxyl transferase domain-containing protein [Pseudomonadota bacterium]